LQSLQKLLKKRLNPSGIAKPVTIIWKRQQKKRTFKVSGRELNKVSSREPKNMNPSDKMNDIVSLSKRRGFVYPSSEIYGGLANAYEYGPLGVELKRNLINLWWKRFITQRPDMVGLDSSIILHPKTWEASGHVGGFSDPLIDCKECQRRKRADHLIEEYYQAKGEEKQFEGLPDSELDQIIQTEKIPCPYCGGFNWTKVRQFNLLFETSIGIVPETESKAYLRGETAQGIFTTFKNILD